MISVEEAQDRLYQAESDLLSLRNELGNQTTNFGERAGSYIADAYDMSFDGSEFDPHHAMQQIARPRRLQREDLVEGIQHARKFKGLARWEAHQESTRELKKLQEKFAENPWMDSKALVGKYGRLLAQQAEDQSRNPEVMAKAAAEEEQLSSMIRDFDQKSRELLEVWESDTEYLKVQYEVCTELTSHVERAKHELELAEDAMSIATLFDESNN